MTRWRREEWADHSLAFGPMAAVLVILSASLLAGCGSTSVVSTREIVACPEDPPPAYCAADPPPIKDETDKEALETIVRLDGWGKGCALETRNWRWASKVCRAAAAKTKGPR